VSYTLASSLTMSFLTVILLFGSCQLPASEELAEDYPCREESLNDRRR